jgi:hypothetical protein
MHAVGRGKAAPLMRAIGQNWIQFNSRDIISELKDILVFNVAVGPVEKPLRTSTSYHNLSGLQW